MRRWQKQMQHRALCVPHRATGCSTRIQLLRRCTQDALEDAEVLLTA